MNPGRFLALIATLTTLFVQHFILVRYNAASRGAGTALADSGITTLLVRADQPWTATGIDLTSGEKFTVSAHGLITTNLNGATAKPSGTPPNCSVAGDVRIPFVAPYLPCWSLIGRVGQSGEAFEVGDAISTTAATAGELYLGVNDNFFGDNSGAWVATVTVGPGSGSAPTVGPSIRTNRSSDGNDRPAVTSQQQCIAQGDAKARNNTHGVIQIMSGTGAFAQIGSDKKVVEVAPGMPLDGRVTMHVLNNGPGFAVAPLIETISWSNTPQTSWVPIANLRPGESTLTSQINGRAPLQSGTYAIIFAFQLEMNGANVASGTNWSRQQDNWDDGNEIARFDSLQIEEAQRFGCTIDPWLMKEGFQLFYIPADAITLEVGPPRSTQRPTPPTLQLFLDRVDGLTVCFNGVMMPTTPVANIPNPATWNFGDGGPLVKSWFPAQHTYAHAGTYHVTVTAVDSNGLTASVSASVTVLKPIVAPRGTKLM